MKQHGRGHIVNITSVGGHVSGPHLLPYSCAKFALAGFSIGSNPELRAYGIHVLTAIPGSMRIGSYLNAQFKGDARNEFARFAILANLPCFSIAAGYAARRARQALERESNMCTISLPAKFLVACEALAPVFPELSRKAQTRSFLLEMTRTRRTQDIL
ncbi:MAG: SDR family NAD(P)-dependent oxidoreductase [Acidobacteriaceae bacterium]|nr:SDR family NAD(P)-dependent oxidoreductase [Acidobacteriaceae bacterium]